MLLFLFHNSIINLEKVLNNLSLLNGSSNKDLHSKCPNQHYSYRLNKLLKCKQTCNMHCNSNKFKVINIKKLQPQQTTATTKSKLWRITQPGLPIQKNSIFGHYSRSNSRSNSGLIFDLRSSLS